MPPKLRMPYMLPADNALRRKIGCNVDLGEIFTPERIAQCQEIVNHAHAETLSEIRANVEQLGKEFIGAADDHMRSALVVKEGSAQALTIRKKMEELGFSFGFKVALSLYEYLHTAPAYSSDVLMIVCKHIAVLNIILRENISDDGGRLGREMLADLQKLIKKSQHN